MVGLNLLIVGRGIAGSMLAHHAIDRGHKPTVVAPPDRPPASAAALCIVRPDWFPAGSPSRDDADWSLAWYERRDMVTVSQARWTTFRGGEPRLRDGFYAVDPARVLLVDQEVVSAEFVARPGVWSVEHLSGFQECLTDSNSEDYDAVVLCLGSGSDREGQRSWGATTVWDVDLDGPVIAGHEDRPRNALYSVSHTGRQLRFGSSKAPTEGEALDRQVLSEMVAHRVGIVPAGASTERVVGCRLMPARNETPGLIRRVSDRVWACDGFGRVGFSLAPARMWSLIQLIETGGA